MTNMIGVKRGPRVRRERHERADKFLLVGSSADRFGVGGKLARCGREAGPRRDEDGIKGIVSGSVTQFLPRTRSN